MKVAMPIKEVKQATEIDGQNAIVRYKSNMILCICSVILYLTLVVVVILLLQLLQLQVLTPICGLLL